MLPVARRVRDDTRGQESAPKSRGVNLTMSQSGKAPAQAPEYRYDALPDGQFIRMLTLYPGSPDDPLEGKLEFFNIASPKPTSHSHTCGASRNVAARSPAKADALGSPPASTML